MSEAVYAWANTSTAGSVVFFLALVACVGLASYLVHKERLLFAVPLITGIGTLTYIYINGAIASQGLSDVAILQVVGVVVPAGTMLIPFLAYPGDVKRGGRDDR